MYEMLFAKHLLAAGLQWHPTAQDIWPKTLIVPDLQRMFAYCMPQLCTSVAE